MLASVKPIAIVTVVWGIGLCLVVYFFLFNTLRLRIRHPLPHELKAASPSDRRKLAQWVKGQEVEVNPDLTRVYVRYVRQNAPLLTRRYWLYSLFGVFTAGLGFLGNPVKHPEALLLIILMLIVVVWSTRERIRLERFVTSANEASRDGSS